MEKFLSVKKIGAEQVSPGIRFACMAADRFPAALTAVRSKLRHLLFVRLLSAVYKKKVIPCIENRSKPWPAQHFYRLARHLRQTPTTSPFFPTLPASRWTPMTR